MTDTTERQWQPIETARRDGTEIIGWRKDCGCINVKYTCMEAFMTEKEMEGYDEETRFAYDWFYADFVHGGRLDDSEIPTHWMPLPEGPKE